MGAEGFASRPLGVEALENRGFLADGNAGPLVQQFDLGLPAGRPGAQEKGAARRRERNRVGDQVAENLHQSTLDAVDPKDVGLRQIDPQVQAVVRDRGLHLHHRFQQTLQVERRHFGAGQFGIEARGV